MLQIGTPSSLIDIEFHSDFLVLGILISNNDLLILSELILEPFFLDSKMCGIVMDISLENSTFRLLFFALHFGIIVLSCFLCL